MTGAGLRYPMYSIIDSYLFLHFTMVTYSFYPFPILLYTHCQSYYLTLSRYQRTRLRVSTTYTFFSYVSYLLLRTTVTYLQQVCITIYSRYQRTRLRLLIYNK